MANTVYSIDTKDPQRIVRQFRGYLNEPLGFRQESIMYLRYVISGEKLSHELLAGFHRWAMGYIAASTSEAENDGEIMLLGMANELVVSGKEIKHADIVAMALTLFRGNSHDMLVENAHRFVELGIGIVPLAMYQMLNHLGPDIEAETLRPILNGYREGLRMSKENTPKHAKLYDALLDMSANPANVQLKEMGFAMVKYLFIAAYSKD